MRQGEEAIRARLDARPRAAELVGVANAGSTAELAGPAAIPPTAPEIVTVEPLDPTETFAPVAAFSSIAIDRIWFPTVERDRTIWFALGIVVFLQLGTVATWIEGGFAPDQGPPSQQLGQVEKSKTIEVEFVEAPHEDADRKPSQQGEDVAPMPRGPDQPAQEAQPEVKEAKAEPETQPDKPPEKPTEKPPEKQKPKDKPLSVDDFDVSMNDYAKAVERAQAQRKQDRQDQQLARSSERPREFGSAPVGKQSAYTKATLAMLSRTKPDLFITRGQVYVRFELDRTGKVRLLEVLKSSGDSLLDSTIVDWLKRAKYELPPPDATLEDLTYDIHFTVR